jgi:hypothetical protein
MAEQKREPQRGLAPLTIGLGPNVDPNFIAGETVDLSARAARRGPFAFVGGAVIGALGGLIGLGGAEFRCRC